MALLHTEYCLVKKKWATSFKVFFYYLQVNGIPEERKVAEALNL